MMIALAKVMISKIWHKSEKQNRQPASALLLKVMLSKATHVLRNVMTVMISSKARNERRDISNVVKNKRRDISKIWHKSEERNRQSASALLLTGMISNVVRNITSSVRKVMIRSVSGEHDRQSASALLLTVMIIAVLTTTTLGAITVRFDQLSSTDRIINSAVAKQAADAGLQKLRDKLALNNTISPTELDLSTFQETPLTSTKSYHPSPRRTLSTYEKADTGLPRCIAVAVLSPWTNDGQYLFQDSSTTNPAMIFNTANIVNDTALGTVNQGNPSTLTDTQKAATISQLTGMGHFYNPFAPANSSQNDVRYWTVKMGGPNDEFLTQKSVDGVTSQFKGLDMVYAPGLPRFRDSGLLTNQNNTFLERKTGDELRILFENVIKNNNFKVWLDASMTDSQLYEYGLGDLFVTDPNYRVTWIQPSIWNDTPELTNPADPYATTAANEDPYAPYVASNVDDTTQVTWAKKTVPLYTSVAADSGWKASIIKGTKSFSFIKLAVDENAKEFIPGASITGSIYGSLEGIRLNQPMTLNALTPDRQPLNLDPTYRSSDMGRYYGVKFLKIGPVSTVLGVPNVNVTFQLGAGDYNTPKYCSNDCSHPAKGGDMGSLIVLAGPQISTYQSVSNVSVPIVSITSGANVPVTFAPTNCAFVINSLTACPAEGDLVSLSKGNLDPMWGRVKINADANYNPAGDKMIGFTLDKLRKYPKPARQMASTYIDSNGTAGGNFVAYYGGAVDMNDYDGGYNSEVNELWIYDPQANSWLFRTPSGSAPPALAGASMVYDSLNKRLILTGGYYHESVKVNTGGMLDKAFCEQNPSACLYTNHPGIRVAKRLNNDVYAFSLAATGGAGSWEKIAYSFTAGEKIQNDAKYTVRVTSTLADRSGMERWSWNGKNKDTSTLQTIYVTPGAVSDVTIYPSAAGYAIGDDLYVYGKRQGGDSFSAWAKVNSVDFANSKVNITIYGYSKGASEVSIVLSSVALQVVNREVPGSECNGVDNGGKYSCHFSDMTGYAVGDSVVMENYDDTGRTLNYTLSGYVSYMDSTNKDLYFVADEKLAAVYDFSSPTDLYAQYNTAGNSAVKFPAPKYGAAFALQGNAPAVPNTRVASYWQGAAKNLVNFSRFDDVWRTTFTLGASGPASVVWSFASATNAAPDPTANAYKMQVVRPASMSQFNTTNNTLGDPQPPNPAITADKHVADKRTGQDTIVWNDDNYWRLEIDGALVESGKIVANSPMTIEKQYFDGKREVFHGIVYNYADKVSPPTSCPTYNSAIICVRHNPSYPSDSGITGNSANSKISFYPSIITYDVINGGSATWNSGDDSWTLTLSGSDKFVNVPPVGAMVMAWKQDNSTNQAAFTFTIGKRTYINGSTQVTIFPSRLTTETDAPLPYSASQSVTKDASIDRLMTLTDFNLPRPQGVESYKGWGAGEWITTVNGGTNQWTLRGSNKSPTNNDRPDMNRASATAVLSAGGGSTFYTMGGTYGVWPTLWRETSAGKNGSTTQDMPTWAMGLSGAQSTNDAVNRFGASLVVYQGATNPMGVYFGGRTKTDSSYSDYGWWVGAYMLGRPDVGSYKDANGIVLDGSYFITDDANASGTDSYGFGKTLETNLSNSTVPSAASFSNSLSLTGNGNQSGEGLLGKVCNFVGQLNTSPVGICSDKQELVHLGRLGRFDSAIGGSWGNALVLSNPGNNFKKQSVSNADKPSLIMSAPTLSGGTATRRYEASGYTPYRCDTGVVGCLSVPYGKLALATNYGSDKTQAYAVFGKLPTTSTQGGAILVTTVGVGNALTSTRGTAFQQEGWYSYCASSSIYPADYSDPAKRYTCKYPTSKYLSWTPDPEDLVFMFNASLNLAASDAYKVVGYYGGVKRGYLVVARSGEQPTVTEIVP